MSDLTIKSCVNCKHWDKNLDFPRCNRPKPLEPDVIFGKTKTNISERCEKERCQGFYDKPELDLDRSRPGLSLVYKQKEFDNRCGVEGKYFEPCPPTMKEKLWSIYYILFPGDR